MEWDLPKDTLINVDMIKEMMEANFPDFTFKFHKPLFDPKYLRVIKSTYECVIISTRKGRLKVRASSSDPFAGSARNNLLPLKIATEDKVRSFEKMISDYLYQELKRKRLLP